MGFHQLEKAIKQLVHQAEGNISLAITTPDGQINIREKEEMPAASLIKIPIVMTYLKFAEYSMMDLDKKLDISQPVGGAGVLHYLSGKQTMSIMNLMELAIIVSDNSASNRLIDEMGVEAINLFSNQVGAHQTELRRYFMDHIAAQSGIENTTTAHDMNLLLALMDKENGYLNRSSQKAMYRMLANQQFRHKLARSQPIFDHPVVIANKTGELTSVEHDVGIFTKGSQKVIASVLTDNWDRNEKGQGFIADIGEAVIHYLQNRSF